MDVTFKQGERYQLGDKNISISQGISDTAGASNDSFQEDSGDGFPYECFSIDVSDRVNENAFVDIAWKGESNSLKTYLYVYNTAAQSWDQIEAAQTAEAGVMTLQGTVALKDHLVDGAVKVMVQNGEGYTPAQYAPGAQGQAVTTSNVMIRQEKATTLPSPLKAIPSITMRTMRATRIRATTDSINTSWTSTTGLLPTGSV